MCFRVDFPSHCIFIVQKLVVLFSLKMSFKWSEECQKFTMFKEGIDIFNKAGLFKISEDQSANFDSHENNPNKSNEKYAESSVEESSNHNQRLKQDAEKTKAQIFEKEMGEKFPFIQQYKTAQKYQQMMTSKMTQPQSWMQPEIVMRTQKH